MDETALRLDGNALAGMLRELFVHDMTAANVACAGCGAVAQIGAQLLYDYPDGPGAVLRCRSCETMLMVLVHAGGRYRMAAGMRWIEVADGG
jgi:ribosomal protein S27E